MAGLKAFKGIAAAGIVAMATAMACGGGGDGDDESGDGTNTATGINTNYGTGTGTNTDLPAECQSPVNDAGCVGVAYEGESQKTPTDIYVMFDVSCSMSCSVDESGCCSENQSPPGARIIPVREAMTAFLQDPASRGVSVGLGFFGDHNVDEPNARDVCTVEAHEDATVEIGELPDNANALIAALENEQPQGGTPTHLAIEGACNHVADWREANPGRNTVILLVTDGIPEYSCNANFPRAISAAEACHARGFDMYVLGINSNNNGIGGSVDQLNEMAQAGGTSEAYLTDSNDVAASVLEALNAIREDAVIPCDLRIPDPPSGDVLNYSMINIGICDSELVSVFAPRVESSDACGDSDGWYYDDSPAPEMIHLCNATCDTVSVAGSTLFFSIGCETIVEIQ